MTLMLKKVVYLTLVLLPLWAIAQECPKLSYPSNGSVGIPVDATITWPAVDGIVGYLISLGTTPGGGDILSRRSAGQINSFKPEVGLPENTLIYVMIELFIADQPLRICGVEFFTTEDVTTPPLCTNIANPVNGASGVLVTSEITWNYASKATGYRLTVGSSPGDSDIIDNLDVGNALRHNPSENLPQDTTIYVRIIPYNENGAPLTCAEESFNTGAAVFNCGPFTDPVSGQSINLRPVVDFPNVVGLCQNNIPATIKSDDVAHGFRWFSINEDGSETLLSTEREVAISSLGIYRYEAYNIIEEIGNSIECTSVVEFSVVFSDIPLIREINVFRNSTGLQVEVLVEGIGNYEFALDDINGPYQNGNIFMEVSSGAHDVFVRDKNGCGITRGLVEAELSQSDFPEFFTPNGDGINDFWQIRPSKEGRVKELEYLQVFDRYGVLLTQITRSSNGWDGNFNGRPLPSAVYWFKAADNYKNIVRGYFLLKR